MPTKSRPNNTKTERTISNILNSFSVCVSDCYTKYPVRPPPHIPLDPFPAIGYKGEMGLVDNKLDPSLRVERGYVSLLVSSKACQDST